MMKLIRSVLLSSIASSEILELYSMLLSEGKVEGQDHLQSPSVAKNESKTAETRLLFTVSAFEFTSISEESRYIQA
jgi:hypothetical protein